MLRNMLLAALLIGLLSQSSHAQSSENEGCVIVLKDAEKSYEQGKLEKIPSILEACIESGFSKEEKIKAYRLLTLTYLFDDNKEMAEKSIENMLKLDPEHVINEAIDPIEFIYLYNEYRTEPIFTYGINGGANMTFVRLIEQYGFDNVNAISKYDTNGTFAGGDKYYTQASIQGGLNGSMLLMKNLNLNLGATYKSTKIWSTKNYAFNTFDNSVDTLVNFGRLTNVEKHSWVKFPLSLTYDIKLTPKFSTYIQLGGSAGVLVSAKSTLTRTYETTSFDFSSSSIAEVTGPPENVRMNRNYWNYSISGGLGFKYRIPKGNIFLDVRYNYAVRQLNYKNKYRNSRNTIRWGPIPANPDLLYKYYSIDNDVMLDDLAFTIGYSRFFYNPKKKEKSKKEKELTGYKRNKDLQ